MVRRTLTIHLRGEANMTRVFVAIAVGFGILASNAAAEEKVDFTKQILPIFKESCEKCHGEKRASGKMRLHTAAGLKEKWDADKGLITAGKPDESELYKRLVLPKGDKKL